MLRRPTRILSAVLMLLTMAALPACQPAGPNVGGGTIAARGHSTTRPGDRWKPDLGWEGRPLDKNGMTIWVYDVRHLLGWTDFRIPKADRSLSTSGPDSTGVGVGGGGGGSNGGSIFGGGGGGDAGAAPVDSEAQRRQAEAERFIAMIKASVLADSWEPKGLANILENDGLLVVRQTPLGHRLLAHLLADLAEHRPVQITVEFRAFVMPAATLRNLWPEQPTWLTDKEVSRVINDLPKARNAALTSLRLTLLDGHDAFIMLETQRDYTSALPAPPRDANHPDGLSTWVRATASPDREHVRLSVRFATEYYRPSSQPDNSVGFQVESCQEIGASMIVPNAHTAVWTWVQDQRGMLLLIRPQILPQDEADEK